MDEIQDLMLFGGRVYKISSEVASTVWKGFSTMATNNKEPRLMKKIGTHNGIFHCDEAFACYMLKQLPQYEDAEIVRTRNQEILDECDIVVDVGGVYDPKIHRYDHHQRGFEHSLSSVLPKIAANKFIKLSSAGLVYAHFGMEVVSEMLRKGSVTVGTECLQHIYLNLYETFVEEIDAIDNGVPMFAEGKPKYRINSHLSSRISRINPKWNTLHSESADDLFVKAMNLVGSEFKECVFDAVNVWWPAREIVKKAIENRKTVHESGEIIYLASACPWKEHLFSLEEEMGLVEEIKFCVFHDKGDSWRVQAIPVQPESFICRVFLHKDWRGTRDEELSAISGIAGCIFCHGTGFIGGNKTKEGAIQMALKSLKAALVDRE